MSDILLLTNLTWSQRDHFYLKLSFAEERQTPEFEISLYDNQ